MDILIGIALPVVIEVVNKDVKDDDERFIVAVLTCFVIACAVRIPDIISGNQGDILNTFWVIFASALSTFNLYWRNSFSREWLQKRLGVAQ